MVKVPPEVKAIFEKQRVIPMATADKSARPNVILVGMWYWADDETLIVSENYLNKTKANLLENPVVAIFLICSYLGPEVSHATRHFIW